MNRSSIFFYLLTFLNLAFVYYVVKSNGAHIDTISFLAFLAGFMFANLLSKLADYKAIKQSKRFKW